ncbi:hypothetical protein [Nocardia terpenica]|uniref:hypothetical protein n=1 Tax=Nocardia terpenica TaxID=455432 RepID=UPI0012FE64A6|nr:hypothetical protein [Nocardia terpenica]
MSAPGVGTKVFAALGDPRRGGLPATARDDAVTALAAGWLVGGLALAAWSQAEGADPGAFSAGHAVFATGVLATAGWVVAVVWRNLRGGRRGFAAIPLGYRAAVLALVLFVCSVLADLIWHLVFGGHPGTGRADAVDLLLGPTHLGVALALFLMITSPLRSAMARPDIGDAPPLRLLWPALLAAGLAAALVLRVIGYGDALTYSAVRIVEVFSQVDGAQVRGLAAAIVISAAVLLLPLLFAARRWRLPFGAALLTMLPLVVLSGAQTACGNVAVLIAVATAAVVVEVLTLCLDPCARRPVAYWVFAGAAAFFTWSLYIGVAAAAAGRVPSVVELWTGTPIAAALFGWLLAVLMLPGRVAGD